MSDITLFLLLATIYLVYISTLAYIYRKSEKKANDVRDSEDNLWK